MLPQTEREAETSIEGASRSSSSKEKDGRTRDSSGEKNGMEDSRDRTESEASIVEECTTSDDLKNKK